MVQVDKGSEAPRLHKCRLGGYSIRQEEHIKRNFQCWVNDSFLVQQETEICCTHLARSRVHGCKLSSMWGYLDEKDSCWIIWLEDVLWFTVAIKVVSNSLRIQYFMIGPSISTFGITIYDIVCRGRSCCWSTFLQRNKIQIFWQMLFQKENLSSIDGSVGPQNTWRVHLGSLGRYPTLWPSLWTL